MVLHTCFVCTKSYIHGINQSWRPRWMLPGRKLNRLFRVRDSFLILVPSVTSEAVVDSFCGLQLVINSGYKAVSIVGSITWILLKRVSTRSSRCGAGWFFEILQCSRRAPTGFSITLKVARFFFFFSDCTAESITYWTSLIARSSEIAKSLARF